MSYTCSKIQFVFIYIGKLHALILSSIAIVSQLKPFHSAGYLISKGGLRKEKIIQIERVKYPIKRIYIVVFYWLPTSHTIFALAVDDNLLMNIFGMLQSYVDLEHSSESFTEIILVQSSSFFSLCMSEICSCFLA